MKLRNRFFAAAFSALVAGVVLSGVSEARGPKAAPAEDCASIDATGVQKVIGALEKFNAKTGSHYQIVGPAPYRFISPSSPSDEFDRSSAKKAVKEGFKILLWSEARRLTDQCETTDTKTALDALAGVVKDYARKGGFTLSRNGPLGP